MEDWFWNSPIGKGITDGQKSIDMWAKVQIGLLAGILVSTIVLIFKRN